MKPAISVVIPAYNEEQLIAECINSLRKQTLSSDEFEIIVVDNGSHDNTAKIARELNTRLFTFTKKQGCGASRNYGASMANGSIIAFIDADSVAFPDWLERIQYIFLQKQIVCVGGRAVPNVQSFFNKLIFYYYDLLHITHILLGSPIMGGYNMAVKMSAYKSVGGINSDLLSCDDWDLALNLGRKYGRKSIKYSLDLKVYASTRKNRNLETFVHYAKDGISNYINIIILKRRKANSTFNIR